MTQLPPGRLPVRDLTTREILFGARTTSFRYELLTHDPATGIDSLAGYLDGVQPGGSLTWSAAASVKKSGNLAVTDLAIAAPGRTRIADINIVKDRIRPVLIIDGLPETPLGLYKITGSPERWSGTGRTFAIEMHDKSTVLEQDAYEYTFTAPNDVPALAIVKEVIESAGERIDVDGSDLRKLSSPLVWPVGPGASKLAIVNEILAAISYNALWVDGVGAFRATPYVRPADRSVRYSMLNDDEGKRLMRELVDGEESIYLPRWVRDRNTYKIPNKVIATAQGGGVEAPLSGNATNTNPDSPFSYPSRGEWIVRHITVEVPDFSASPDPAAATIAFLEDRALRALISMSSVQASVDVSTLPLPLELLDAIRFASTPARIDALHTVQSVSLILRFNGLMKLALQEVVSL